MVLKSLKDFIRFKYYDFIFHLSKNYSAKAVIEIKSFTQHCEIVDWINSNIKGNYHHVFSPTLQKDFFWFSRKHEAILFKLIWGGK
jgi:hypothetical protein